MWKEVQPLTSSCDKPSNEPYHELEVHSKLRQSQQIRHYNLQNVSVVFISPFTKLIHIVWIVKKLLLFIYFVSWSYLGGCKNCNFLCMQNLCAFLLQQNGHGQRFRVQNHLGIIMNVNYVLTRGVRTAYFFYKKILSYLHFNFKFCSDPVIKDSPKGIPYQFSWSYLLKWLPRKKQKEVGSFCSSLRPRLL